MIDKKNTTSSEIVCIAEFIAKEGKTNQLYQALSKLLEPTRNEEGCMSYELCQSLNNPRKFTMVEKYRNQAAFDFHVNQPYLVSFKETREHLVESLIGTIYKIAEPCLSEA